MLDLKPLFLLLLLFLLLKVTNGQDNGKWSTTTSTEISTVVGCKVEMEWVNAGPVDEFAIYKNQEHILSFESGVSHKRIGNERLRINQLKRRNGELITLTINNVETNDNGIYTCKLLPSNQAKNVTLKVTELKWKTGKEIKAVNPWTPVRMSWEHIDSSGTGMVTALRRMPGNSDWAELLARWENSFLVQVNDQLRSRLEVANFTTTATGNKRTSMVLKDVTRDDLSYQYQLLLEFGKCQKYSEPIELIPEKCEAVPECSMTVRNVLIIFVVLLLLALIMIIIFLCILRRRLIHGIAVALKSKETPIDSALPLVPENGNASSTKNGTFGNDGKDESKVKSKETPLDSASPLVPDNGNASSTKNGTVGNDGKDESKSYNMEW